MKLTKSQLRQIIREELLKEDDYSSKVLDELHYMRDEMDTYVGNITRILSKQDKITKTQYLKEFNYIYKKYIDPFFKEASIIGHNVKD